MSLELKENIVDDVSFGAIVVIRDQLLKLQREGKKVFRFESGDPSFEVPPHVKEAISEAIKNNKTHYTDSTGIPELREAISRKLVRKNNIRNADASNVLVTNGGMNGLYVAFRSLISQADEVIIIKFARENNIFIVSDEAYEDVIFDNMEHFSPGSLYEDTISLYSMSKSYAMSGLRMGYIHVKNEKLIERMKKMLRCTINGVNSITQYGAIAALSGPQNYIEEMRKEYQKRRDLIYEAAKESNYLEPFYPQGAFYLWARIKKYPDGLKDSWDFSKYILEKESIGSTPGPVFGPNNDQYIRFAFSAKTEDIEEGSLRLKEMK